MFLHYFCGIQIAQSTFTMLTLRKNHQRGFTILELLTVVVIVAIIANLAVVRFLSSQDRARIAAATGDVFAFKKALAMYDIDNGSFSKVDRNAVTPFVQDLLDPNGSRYMTLPKGSNFADFTYDSQQNGDTYLITVTARDRVGTKIYADPARTWR